MLLLVVDCPKEVGCVIYQYLLPTEAANFALTCRRYFWEVMEWCKCIGLPSTISRQLQQIHSIHAHPNGGQVSFAVYTEFLRSLQEAKLSELSPALNSWIVRYLVANQPRPRRDGSLNSLDGPTQRFDFGYSGAYWCDAFGVGVANDYFRNVGDFPNIFQSFCAAGSDGDQYLRWEGQPPEPVHWEERQGIQVITNSKFDRVFTTWRDSIFHFRLHNQTDRVGNQHNQKFE